MKQKTIILIWGQQGCGKSTTIKLVNHELHKKYVNSAHSYTMPLPAGDIDELLTCNNHLIGIESMGDFLKPELETRLIEYATKHNCDIIICACRMYNDVSTFVETLAAANGYRLFKVTNYRAKYEPETTQNNLCLISSIQIVELIDKLINGLV